MKKIKMVVDVLMAIGFILLMCNSKTGNLAHEIIGISVIVLFIVHQILNRNFYKNIFKGKYNTLRICYLVIDLLLLIMMIIMVISSFMVSRKVLTFAGLGNDEIGRKLHILSAYTIYMLCGLHLGIHYNAIVKLEKEKKIILNIFLILFGMIFGINGFIKRQFITKITLNSLYPLYFEESIITCLIDYIGIFIMFVMIGYGIYNLVNLKPKNKVINL